MGLDGSEDREHELTVIKDTAGNFFVGTFGVSQCAFFSAVLLTAALHTKFV